MSEQRAQQEPSMEEILASIRRIISEDGTEGEQEAAEQPEAAEGTAPPEVEAPEEEKQDDDVLELTQMVQEDGEIIQHGPPEQVAADPNVRKIYLGDNFHLD